MRNFIKHLWDMEKKKIKRLLQKEVKNFFKSVEEASTKRQKPKNGLSKKELRIINKEIDKILSI